MSLATYRPSGRVGWQSLPLSLLAMPVSILVGVAYAYSLHWIPLIFLNLIATLVAGGLIAVIVCSVQKLGRVRNGPLLAVLAIICLFLMGIAKLVTQREMLIAEVGSESRTTEDAIGSFRRIFDLAGYFRYRMEAGWTFGQVWQYDVDREEFRTGIRGPLVVVVWLIEWGSILSMVFFVLREELSTPFSESTGQWADHSTEILSLSNVDSNLIETLTNAQSFHQLYGFDPSSEHSPNRKLIYTLSETDGHQEEAFLSIDLETTTANAQGVTQKKKRKLVRNAILDPSQSDEFVRWVQANASH